MEGWEALTDAELQTLATHELGHALGLDHTTFSTSGLMNHVPIVMFPSTLNLYAVYLLSRSTSVNDLPQQPVTLPGIIVYAMVSQAELDSVNIPVMQTVTLVGFLTNECVAATAYHASDIGYDVLLVRDVKIRASFSDSITQKSLY